MQIDWHKCKKDITKNFQSTSDVWLLKLPWRIMVGNKKKKPHYQWKLRFSYNLKLGKRPYIWKHLCSFFDKFHHMVNWLWSLTYNFFFFFSKKKMSILFRNVRNKAIHCWKLLMMLCYLSPANKYMLKFNNRNTRTRCKTCLKLTIKTLAQRHCFGLNFQFWK